MIIVWFLLAVVVISGAVYLVVIGNRAVTAQENEGDPLMARLAEFSERGEVVSLEQIELSQPFWERVIVPALLWLGGVFTRLTPHQALLDTIIKLEQAGNPGGMGAPTFLMLPFIFAAIFGGAIFGLAKVLNWWPNATSISVLIVFVTAGYFMPRQWLRIRINRRQAEIRTAMPDTLDLLTICAEAGLSLYSAMSKVSEKWENELSLAFARTIREIQLGKLPRDALRDMADRISIPEMNTFVAAVIQSQLLGVSIARVLRIQAEQMRQNRRQYIEKNVHAFSTIKFIILAIFLVPVTFLWLVAPILGQLLPHSMK